MMESLFTLTVFELFVGGGGRLTPIGPVTVRMILFGLCVLTWLLVAPLSRHKRAEGHLLAVGLVLAYLLSHLPPVMVGLLKGADAGTLFGEMQQSLYWLAAPFLASMLRRPPMIEHVARLVILAGGLLALAYILALAALAANIAQVYPLLDETTEFFFRGDSFFFYKGFLYLGISIVFLIALQPRRWVLLTMLVVSALVLTLTRGFLLSTSVAILLMLVALGRWRAVITASVVVVVAAAMVWIYLPTTDDSLSSQRDTSTSQRVEDMTYIADHMSIGTIVFGEGFGSLINSRANIENTFLWALWKLGIAGLLFWFVPLALCIGYYARLSRKDPRFRLATAFFFGTVMVYVQTATNPYLNNPIGLSFVILALFSLRTLAHTAPAAPAAAGAATATP